MTENAAPVGTFDIVEIDGARAPEHLTPFIEFAEGSLHGQVINMFRGSTTVADSVLTCGPVVSTLMAGPPESMAAESRVYALLAEPLTITFRGSGDEVLLTGADGDLVLRRRAGDTDHAATL